MWNALVLKVSLKQIGRNVRWIKLICTPDFVRMVFHIFMYVAVFDNKIFLSNTNKDTLISTAQSHSPTGVGGLWGCHCTATSNTVPPESTNLHNSSTVQAAQHLRQVKRLQTLLRSEHNVPPLITIILLKPPIAFPTPNR